MEKLPETLRYPGLQYDFVLSFGYSTSLQEVINIRSNYFSRTHTYLVSIIKQKRLILESQCKEWKIFVSQFSCIFSKSI